MAHKIPRSDNSDLGNLIPNTAEDGEDTVFEDESVNVNPASRSDRNLNLHTTSHPLNMSNHTGHPIYVQHNQPPNEDSNQYRQIRGVSLLSGLDWNNRDSLHNLLTQRNSPERFMASHDSPYMNNLLNIVTSNDDGMRHKNMRLSGRMPTWVWFLLAKSLGIRLKETDKPIVATILHVFTLCLAVLYSLTGLWYNISDILSEYSKTTVLVGSVSILLGLAWIFLGIYAHKLAGRLFSNKNFVESVRMHAKTFLKISTVGLLVIFGVLNIGIYSYESYNEFVRNETACKDASTFPSICKVMYGAMVSYSVICLIWNVLVGSVLLSVCRTHTISIRRFMRELSLDAKIHELSFNNDVIGQNSKMDALLSEQNTQGEDLELLEDWFIWDDKINSDPTSNVVTSQSIFLENITGQATGNNTANLEESRRRKSAVSTQNSIVSTQNSIVSNNEPTSDTIVSSTNVNVDENVSNNTPAENFEIINDQDPVKDSADNKQVVFQPTLMPNENILFSYWKLCQRLTVTSRFLQRWLSSWIAFIVLWCANYIIYWTTHGATIPDILQFTLPLLLLLIVCSAYAEVNSEGQRLLRCICPTEGRLSILFFMYQQPLQMQVYSFAITYNALLGVILAFSVAIASRIILDEVL